MQEVKINSETEEWEGQPSSSSASAVLKSFEKRWLYFGLGCLVFGVLAKYFLVQYEIFLEISWGTIAFFVIYTVLLFLVFIFCSNHSNSRTVVTTLRPNGLTRFRSYLTFLPITQIIQHGDIKEAFKSNDTNKLQADKLDENELSVRINVQKDFVIQAILDEFIAPWYTKISSNNAILQQSKGILQKAFQNLTEKIQRVDRNEFGREVIETIHLHWKEYCDTTQKGPGFGDNILKCFKFVHPFLQDEEKVTKRYEQLLCPLLEELLVSDLQSAIFCQFLSGILVKSVCLYYIDLICQPQWINSNLITILSSASTLAELAGSSSQNSSAPATPIPDRSPKTLQSENGSIFSTPTPTDLNLTATTPLKKNNSPFLAGLECMEQTYFFGERCPGDDTIFKDSILKDDHFDTLTPKSTKLSPKPSVTIALGGVLPTTALPLLPTGTFCLDQNSTFGYSCQERRDSSTKEIQKSSSQSSISHESFLDEISSEVSSTVVEKDGANIIPETDNSSLDPSEKLHQEFPLRDNDEPKSVSSNKHEPTVKTPTQYYSFDEACKTRQNLLVDCGTLSVDGAVETQKRDRSSTHELKICNGDSEFDKKPSRSPVYEEPEDFAASIAKLRSLLEQRDSRKNLTYDSQGDEIQPVADSVTLEDVIIYSSNGDIVIPEDSSSSTPIPRSNATAQPGSSNDIDSNNLSTNEGTTLYEMNESVPVLKCFFLNIAIPKVESCNDSGGQYDFYCIQYEGVYFDEKVDSTPPRIILRNTTVKRRFKEFLLLQSKLEDDSQWKPHLKGIKTPNRWLNLSFSKADATATRKAMLERYLHQICYHPVLGSSRDVLHFMAYGDDGFSLDPMDISDPKHLLSDRLEKLAKKFTGVMNSLKDALPSFESAPPSPRSVVGTPIDGGPEPSITAFQFQEKLFPDDFNDNSKECNWTENLVPRLGKQINSIEIKSESPPGLVNLENIAENLSEELADESTLHATYPLAAALTQFLCDVLWLPNCRPHNASVSTFMSISGKSLENYVQETIDVFLSEEAVLGYLEWLTKSLKAETDSSQDLPFEFVTESELKNCLRKRIPAWVRWMWGRNRLDLTIDRITGFFQTPTINHDLVLSIMELLFSKIVLQNGEST